MSWFRVFLLFLLVKWAAMAVYAIPTGSMEPVLHGDPAFFRGDRVLVNKLAFGLRMPFTNRRLVSWGEPKRWDIVTFDTLSLSSEGRVLIKRIVGLPGDIVSIHGDGVYVNGERLEPPADVAPYLNYTHGLEATRVVLRRMILGFAKYQRIPYDMPKEPPEAYHQLLRDLKTLHDSVRAVDLGAIEPTEAHALVQKMDRHGVRLVREWWDTKIREVGFARYGVFNTLELTLVPEGHYFCLGDNGPESFDSRMFGWVPRENLIGRAYGIVTPPSRIRDLSGFTKTPGGLGILLGCIAALVLWEFVPGFLVFSWRLRGAIPALGLESGDHVLVDRFYYGLRMPFSNRRILSWRRPRAGDMVCFSLSDGRGFLDLYVGDVLEIGEGEPSSCVVRGHSDTKIVLPPNAIVGRARHAWRPWARFWRIETKSC